MAHNGVRTLFDDNLLPIGLETYGGGEKSIGVGRPRGYPVTGKDQNEGDDLCRETDGGGPVKPADIHPCQDQLQQEQHRPYNFGNAILFPGAGLHALDEQPGICTGQDRAKGQPKRQVGAEVGPRYRQVGASGAGEKDDTRDSVVRDKKKKTKSDLVRRVSLSGKT